jgi:hypothetical protein
MRLLLQISSLFASVAMVYAQAPVLTLPPSGNNQKASVSQFLGAIKVSIDYSSPAVHTAAGEDRRGKIWGHLVPYGLAKLGGGNGKPDPWRAGANENTVFTNSELVAIEGKPLPAGSYGLHMIPGPDEWTIIFSKTSNSWGSFFYEESDDALRVTVKPHKHEYREWLAYDFTERKRDEATVELQWEDLAVPIKINADTTASYLTHLREELKGTQAFNYLSYVSAASFCVSANANLEEGLRWADAALSMPTIGQVNFQTLSTKSQVLAKMGKQSESAELMQKAIHDPSATPFQIHIYARQLISEHKDAEALEAFKFNAQRNGEAWPVNMGLARGYSAVGDVKKALEYAQKALPQSDDLNREPLKAMIKTLSEGHAIAQ